VAGRAIFSSLRIPNFRRYFIGSVISTSGSWVQIVAQAWLVLKLTDSGTALGLVTAAQFGPVLLFATWGGVIADRFPKRKALYVVQTSLGATALALGLLVATGSVEMWMVYVISWCTGCLTAVDLPIRHTFIVELVGPDHLTNAVTMQSVVINLARIVGPTLAATMINTLGLAACFLFNAATFVMMIVSLVTMDERQLRPPTPTARAPGQLREGFAYVRRTREVFVLLVMMGVVGTLGFEMQVILPLIARFTFGGDAGLYSLMTVSMGAGALLAATVVATLGRQRPSMLGAIAIGYGVTCCIAAAAPNVVAVLVALVFVGAASILFLAVGNATLQLVTEPAMRGRVMGLWTTAFLGTTPIGGPIVGWVGEHVSPRWGLGVGGISSIAAGALGYRTLLGLEGLRMKGLGGDVPDIEPDDAAERH
jgi:MFS family permease